MIVGVNDGRAFTRNPCLADEYRWASSGGGVPALYMNLNYIESRSSDYATYGPRGHCAPSDNPCRAFNYGYNAAHDAVANATAVSANASRWWLDIEIANYWSPNPALNALVIQGAISYFREQQTPIGIYSIAPMWQEIAGAFSPDVPLWVAQTDDRVPTSAYCSPAHAFGGGAISLVQHWNGHVDLDYACPSLTLFQAQIPADGSARAPRPLDAQTQGTLPGRTGGNDTYFTVQSRGAGTHLSLRLYFWPNGVDVSNGVFITVFQNNVPITRIRGSDAKSPGEIALDVTLPTANPVVIQLANYNSDALPPLGYWLSPT
jgi:hypothetical protein